MPEPKFYVPHPFQCRGSGVIMDRKALTSDVGRLANVEGEAFVLTQAN